jgi:HAD superfamily, subfamily IIIB (Acid phosphatase)
VLALGPGAVALAAQRGGAVPYRGASGSTFTSVRPTGVGLPQIGEPGTVGADDLTDALRRYHDSGAHERDLSPVDGAALTLRLEQAKARKKSAVKLSGKPAIVLDIDETSLSNYAGLAASGFIVTGLAVSSVVSDTSIKPTLSLYRYARSHGVAVFFLTGRPALIDDLTKAFKSTTRREIQRQGFDIVASVGDQESHLDGGHADRALKRRDRSTSSTTDRRTGQRWPTRSKSC